MDLGPFHMLYTSFSKRFWDEDVWLPPNTTWADLAPGANPNVTYTDYRDLLFPIPMAFGMLCLRYCLERWFYRFRRVRFLRRPAKSRFWFAPAGRGFGIKYTRTKKAPPNVLLDKAYNENRHPNYKQIVGLAKQLDWTERQVERWLRLRRSQDKPSTLTKFCENAWRCLYYSYSFFYGVYILWDKPWLWDINYCWYGYPHQGVTDDIWYYYMISMSFYWALCMSQFWDVKRKDFWQMFIHHIATITLMGLSWLCNLHRIGSLVLVVHDCADILLEMAKMLKYMGWQNLCDCVFGVFTILWIVTRIGVYPFWIIRSTTIEAPKILPMFPAYYIFNTLLLLLLVLHVIWTWLILRIAYRALRAGQMEGDIRSSSSSTEDSVNNENLKSTNSSPALTTTGEKLVAGDRLKPSKSTTSMDTAKMHTPIDPVQLISEELVSVPLGALDALTMNVNYGHGNAANVAPAPAPNPVVSPEHDAVEIPVNEPASNERVGGVD